MRVTDPVADMLTRIRNAIIVRRHQVDIPGSKLKRAIAQILRDEGFIEGTQWIEEGPAKILRLTLKYGPDKKCVITGLRRVSRPGLRVYSGKGEVPRVRGGLGLAIVSTSRGVLTDRMARRDGVGGEVLCYIW
jgi:small subunit ribosomal protein S8